LYYLFFFFLFLTAFFIAYRSYFIVSRSFFLALYRSILVLLLILLISQLGKSPLVALAEIAGRQYEVLVENYNPCRGVI
jgi:hypothetical protein